MKALRTGLAALLIASLSSSAFADGLAASASKAVEAAAAEQAGAPAMGGSKLLAATGAVVFVTGFGVGVYGFLNNKNGKYSEFGEASARNVKLGSAGLAAAFGGGVLLLMGTHMKKAPSVAFGAGGLNVSKRITW